MVSMRPSGAGIRGGRTEPFTMSGSGDATEVSLTWQMPQVWWRRL